MCITGNLFDTNKRKLDAKNTYFLPRMLRLSINHSEKLIFFKNKISALEVGL